MANHEITTGDIYEVLMDVKNDVTVVKEKLSNIQETSRDHENRLREVETHKANQDTLTVLQEQIKTYDTAVASIRKDFQKSIDEIQKKLYGFSGGLAVISVIVIPLFNYFTRK